MAAWLIRAPARTGVAWRNTTTGPDVARVPSAASAARSACETLSGAAPAVAVAADSRTVAGTPARRTHRRAQRPARVATVTARVWGARDRCNEPLPAPFPRADDSLP